MTLDVAETRPVLAVSVEVDVAHPYIGDLVVTLIPPSGLGLGNIRLHDRAGAAGRNLRRTYDASTIPRLAALKGKSCKGTWTLRVQDAAAQDEGTLIAFGLELTLETHAAVGGSLATPAPAAAVAAPPSVSARTRGRSRPKSS